MIIRGYQRKEIKDCIVIIILIMIYMILCFILGADVIKNFSRRIILIMVFIIMELMVFINLSYEAKTIHISNNGVYVVWPCLFKFHYSWNEIQYIDKELVRTRGVKSYDYESIICSKIPIKYHKGFLDEYAYVDSDWIFRNSKHVFDIRLDDFKEGQLEEFWSYVPDRLK